ncbi:MAG TPA: response regulator [Caldimonas sp.]|jgi:signal transduction histidine kinase/ActR/RegA family two-component response regulator
MKGLAGSWLDSQRMFERLGREIGVPINDDAIRKVADEQLRMIWTHMAVATIAATVFAMFFAAKMMTPANHVLVQAWIALKLTVAVPRVIQGRLYRRNGRVGGQTWREATDLLLILDGLVWGFAGIWVAQQDIATAALGIACLAGVAGAATFGLQARFRATAAYVAPILGLLATALLARIDEFGVFTGCALFLLLCMLLASAKRAERQLVAIFLLRLHANDVAQERTEAMDLALRQSAAKGQFFTTMNHELRTPLHGILGLTRLIQGRNRDSITGRHLELIQSSGNHLLTLINDLLDMSYLESGEMRPREAECDLHEEIQRLAEIYAVRCNDKGLSWSASIGLPTPCPVRIDVARTRQILHNLLGNAAKFTDHGSLDLAVESAPVSDQNATGEIYVSFVITDTGIGIAKADQQRVFGAFQQASWTGTNALEGTGLGLSIARGLALRMGGDISCKSELGKGSSFTFKARMKIGLALDPIVEDSDVRSPDAGHNVQNPSYRVLLAEDNDVNAIIATAFLTNRGMVCERVESGDEAVQHAIRTTERPDLVLMDCLMPRLDGYAATRQIRERETTLGLPRIPVIALTALSAEEDRQACFAAGMDAVLAKPFTEEDLSRTVRRWLSGQAAADRSSELVTMSA